jgi:protoporphyrinogen oxidase
MGLEYFCNDSDALWKLSDEEMVRLAIDEVARIGILKAEDVEDSHMVRVPKTYPAYFGSYDRFDVIRKFTDGFENLFLVGRNGMHKYNNQDHSMLTAMTAVDNIVNGVQGKENIWAINTEMEYHEEA